MNTRDKGSVPLVTPVVDRDGLVRVDGVVLGRLTGRGTLRVKDTDDLRSRCRGTRYVEVSLAALASLGGES